MNRNGEVPSAFEFGDAGGGSASEERITDAIVKWFRSDKGYGFVQLADGEGDAFLHLKALRAFGRDTAPAGAKLRAVVEGGPRGMQVMRIINMNESGAAEPVTRSFLGAGRPSRHRNRDHASAVQLTGRVKWFDDVRGFGFVSGDDFGRDVFVHCSVLRPAGVSGLDQGQTVTMRVVETSKGREAIEISL
jgi:CspA family cold shock protein